MNKSTDHDQRLPKKEILRKRDDFQRLFKDGKRWREKHLRFYYKEGDRRQVGFTVPKRYGKAVHRNRMKRWMREAYRKHRWEIGDMAVVMMARPESRPGGLMDVEEDLIRFLQSSGIK
jgi:ribonuclease P protein component